VGVSTDLIKAMVEVPMEGEVVLTYSTPPPPMVGDLVCMPYHNGVGSKALDIHKLEAFHHSRLMVRDRVRMSPFL
jgi:hypothetical protein